MLIKVLEARFGINSVSPALLVTVVQKTVRDHGNATFEIIGGGDSDIVKLKEKDIVVEKVQK